MTLGILPSALRGSLRLFEIAPGDFVEPPDFMARLAALLPKPRVNLVRFHGVFAPTASTAPWSHRRSGAKEISAWRPMRQEERTAVERRTAMTWAQRLKHVFNIDIETCVECGGAVKVIACIEDPVVIKKILDHLKKDEATDHKAVPERRAPPAGLPPGLFT